MTGQYIGNYRVTRQIGSGGMGCVFEAVHEQIGRRVAIKTLHPQLAQNPEIVSRFLNEARAVNMVHHPGMVSIFEFGTLPDGAPFIIMEYLDGELLTARLRRSGGRLRGDLLRLSRQIASVLSAAHAQGIIHRDLKPDNVFIIPDPETPGGERIKILDFGIAKVKDADAAGGNLMKTRTGVMMGTPTYMSPEQCRGAGSVDDRADVYALGVMIYQMLTGRLPFIAQGLGELLALHMFTQPTPPRALDPSIPEPVEALVLSMLQKAPELRPSMAQVVAALEQLGQLLGETVALSTSQLTPAPPPIYPSTLGQSFGQRSTLPPPSRRPVFAVAGTVVVVLIMAGVAGYRLRSPSQVASPPEPVQPIPAAQPRTEPRSEPQAPKRAPKAPARVRWIVKSEPSGAKVFRESDGKLLGVTPWMSEEERREGSVEVSLKRRGFSDAQLELSLAHDEEQHVTLVPRDKRRAARREEGSSSSRKEQVIKEDQDVPLLK